MAYTVIGLFKNNGDAENARQGLINGGINTDRVDYSPQSSSGDVEDDVTDYDYEEDERTTSFWDWLFGKDTDDRRRYGRLGSRSHVITVSASDPDEAERARNIMDEYGAIESDRDDYSEEYRNTNLADSRNTDIDTHVDETKNIDVVKEELNIDKEQVQTGGVRVRSRIVEKPIEEDIRLRQERVYVKRNPVNRAVGNADNAFNDETIEVTETGERAVVNKEAKVVEEISVGREVDEKVEHISDTVRETEVDVEDLDSDVDDMNNKDRSDRNRDL